MFEWLGRLRRPLWLAFLVLLPVFTISIINGVADAIFYANGEKFNMGFIMRNYDHHYGINRDFQVFYDRSPDPRPWFIEQLKNPMIWWEKAGMERFDLEAYDGTKPKTTDVVADLSALYRRINRFKPESRRWHHWVYLCSASIIWDDDFSLYPDPWDEAFNELMQYHNANPAANGANFSYILCGDSFLCEMWYAKQPALLHFTTETHEEEARPWKSKDFRAFAPVTARVIEFPLEEEEGALIPPGVFPSRFEQLKSLTANPDAWRNYPVYSMVRQWAWRLGEMRERKMEQYPGSYGKTVQLENQIIAWSGPFATVFAMVHAWALLVVTLVVKGTELAVNFIKNVQWADLFKDEE